MSDKDKPDRDKGSPATPDGKPAQGPKDKTVFRKDDATRRAPVVPPPGEATVIRTRGTGNNVPDPAATDATRIKQASDRTRRPQPESPGQTRVRPGAQPGQGTRPYVAQVEQFQVLKGRFTLEKVIGVGGMGVVYKASDRLKVEAHDREPYVAIKVPASNTVTSRVRPPWRSIFATARAIPKSKIFGIPASVIKIFPGLKSECTIFSSCA